MKTEKTARLERAGETKPGVRANSSNRAGRPAADVCVPVWLSGTPDAAMLCHNRSLALHFYGLD